MTDTSFPFQFSPISKEEYQEDPETKDVHQLFLRLENPGLERVGPQRFVVRAGEREVIKRIYNMQVTEKDVWVVTYPRSGTTWTQEMVWNIVNNCQFDKATKTDIDEKFFFLDMDFLGSGSKGVGPGARSNFIQAAEDKLGERRLIKTHLQLGLLPPSVLSTCKVIYVGRNPKDVAVSYYHHHKMTRNADQSLKFEDFMNFFMKEMLVEDPYLAHIKEAVSLRDSCTNMHFMWYEDMKKNLPGAIKEVSTFLGVELTEDQVHRLSEYLDIKNMKKNPAVNHQDRFESGAFASGESFIRAGVAGGWAKYFNEPLNQKFDTWLSDKLEGTNIDFKWN